jgi:hypothetical protein
MGNFIAFCGKKNHNKEQQPISDTISAKEQENFTKALLYTLGFEKEK